MPTHTHTHTHAYTRAHTHTNIHKHTRTHANKHTRTHANKHTRTQTYTVEGRCCHWFLCRLLLTERKERLFDIERRRQTKEFYRKKRSGNRTCPGGVLWSKRFTAIRQTKKSSSDKKEFLSEFLSSRLFWWRGKTKTARCAEFKKKKEWPSEKEKLSINLASEEDRQKRNEE